MLKNMMTDEARILLQESEINRFLQVTQKTHSVLKKQGRDDLARRILRVGSEQAQVRMKLAGISSHKVYCPKCKKQIRDGQEVEFVNEIGMCYLCDHVEHDY